MIYVELLPRMYEITSSSSSTVENMMAGRVKSRSAGAVRNKAGSAASKEKSKVDAASAPIRTAAKSTARKGAPGKRKG